MHNCVYTVRGIIIIIVSGLNLVQVLLQSGYKIFIVGTIMRVAPVDISVSMMDLVLQTAFTAKMLAFPVLQVGIMG